LKKLLQINSVVNTGSTGRIAEEIGISAIQNGWDSYIAYGRAERNSKSNLIKIGSETDIKLHGLQTRLFDRHGLGSKNATQKFVSKIDSLKPDIIHIHNIHGYYLNIEILFNYLASNDIPVIWTLHDCWPITGHCTYFDYIDCPKWETLCNKCPQTKNYPASYFIDRSRENFILKKQLFNSVKRMTLVPVSNWLGAIMTKSFLNNYPIKTINNGIDATIFKPGNKDNTKRKYNIESKFLILGVASIWDPRKGLTDFIKLSTRLSSEFVILLLGLNAKQIKDLPSQIIGISRTENTKELADLYSAADVFINPTMEDNFPTTNLESLACGTPVITYNTGGSIESVSPGTGIIVGKGDISGLISAIATVKKNGKEYYSDACITRAIKLYDKNDRYMDYINLYNLMLNNTK